MPDLPFVTVSEEDAAAGFLYLFRQVFVKDQEVHLGPTEYRLLKYLITHTDRVYSRNQLLDRVWGATVYVEERTVDVHIRRLRKALSEVGADRYIQTVRGAGYRFSTRDV